MVQLQLQLQPSIFVLGKLFNEKNNLDNTLIIIGYYSAGIHPFMENKLIIILLDSFLSKKVYFRSVLEKIRSLN